MNAWGGQSMDEPLIVCPNCATKIKLTESLAAPLIQAMRQEYESKLTQKEQEVLRREAAIKVQQHAMEQAKQTLDQQVEERLAAARAKIAMDEANKARQAVATDLETKSKELSELQQILQQRNVKLAEAQQAQAELLRKQRELDDARRELELTVEKRVQESLVMIKQMARQEAEDGLKLKVSEKEQQIASMQRQIEELKRKAEQGSQQLQGEAMELQLEVLLRHKFPLDSIEPVAKGESGGDVLQRIMGPSGQWCGSILWEFKRTKNWSDGWLAKLRNDQRSAKAELAILVSTALPKEIETFGQMEGVWVTETRLMLPLALALRQSLLDIANARQVQSGQENKMELVYHYLTGSRFRHRIEAIVEKFSDMQADLDKERKTMTRLWAKREMQIHGVIESTVGMYGDLQGIAGRALPEIEGLNPLMIDVQANKENDQGQAEI